MKQNETSCFGAVSGKVRGGREGTGVRREGRDVSADGSDGAGLEGLNQGVGRPEVGNTQTRGGGERPA